MSSLAPIRPEEMLRRAHAVGNYYGFAPFSALTAQARDRRPAREPYPKELAVSELDPLAQTVAAFLKHVRDAGITPSVRQPLFAWHTNVTVGRPAPKQAVVQFHAIGAPHAIADAVLMRAVRAFIADTLKTEPTLHVNSTGDRETRARYARELDHYLRRSGAKLGEDCLSCAKRDILAAAETPISQLYREDTPASTDHLSEASRKHFENVLEFLEETETSYALAPELTSRANAWTETCFEIRAHGERMAWGARHHELATPFFNAALPSVAAIVRFSVPRGVVPAVREPGKPKAVFLHIGEEAKRTSVRLAEDLRRTRLPIMQMIGIESLTEQMRIAEALKPPYYILMGRKEALEGTVILRERATHTETVIPLENLAVSLKAVI
ncbi:MAG TPA: His/Gly/Thr/Pro-type tRNA ligase C-terminal domain-containing protein [Candidatus Paceibacterota bacterium]